VRLSGILVTLYVRWSSRRVRVRVDVREAWREPTGPMVMWSDVAEPAPGSDIFEATVVVTNRGERPVFVEVLGLETVDGMAGFDDRRSRCVRVVPAGGQRLLVVDEEMADFDMRPGVRGFAELTTGRRVYSALLVPSAPPSAVA
jgi:hypothetical protein